MRGWVGRDLTEAIITAHAPLAPRLGWIVAVGNRLGLNEEAAIAGALVLLFLAAICLVVGLFCRPAAFIAWFVHLCAVSSRGILTYGMDNFANIGLFYLLLAPFPDSYAMDYKIWKPAAKDQSLQGFLRRVLQLHLCVIYFFSGLTKFLGAGWWSGDSLWRALTRPPFDIIPANIVLSVHALLPVAGIAVVMLELGYPIFIWPRRTRLIWLVSVITMHVGIGLTMGLYLFALIMIVLNLAAFGSEFIFRDRLSNNCAPLAAI